MNPSISFPAESVLHEHWLAQKSSPYAYPEVGASASQFPSGYDHDREEAHLRGAITALRGFLEALPAAQRAAVTLRDVEGEDPATICALLGVSDGNLRVLLHRGRLRLRAQLEEWAR